MRWVYVLEAEDNSWYIGSTNNLRRRIVEHLSSYGGKTTKRKQNLKLIYCEGYLNERDGFGREKFLKSGSGRRFLKKQLYNYLATRL